MGRETTDADTAKSWSLSIVSKLINIFKKKKVLVPSS